MKCTTPIEAIVGRHTGQVLPYGERFKIGGDRLGRESATTGFVTQGRRLAGTLELAKPLTHPDVEGSDDLTLFIEIAVPL